MSSAKEQGQRSDLWESNPTQISIKGKELPPLLHKGAERRKSVRHDLNATSVTLKFSSSHGLAKFYMKDISTGGAFIKTSERPRLNSLIEVILENPSASDEALRHFAISARVARHAEEGIGLSFEVQDSKSLRALESYVLQIAESSKLQRTPEVKAEVFSRIAEMKEAKAIAEQRAKGLILRWSLAAGLAILNIVLLVRSESTRSTLEILNNNQHVQSPARFSVEVRSDPTSKNRILIVRDQSGVEISPSVLPPPIRTTIEGAARLEKAPRRSKTAPDSRVRLR